MKPFSICLFLFSCLAGLSLPAYTAFAQTRVSVGAVVKYTGGPAKLDELKEDEVYLSTLESQVAASIIKAHNIDYIDRTSVTQIFQELNLSSDVAFNGASGALRGLLGRLDFLIVIDGTSPELARMRAIDLETGAVRATAMCKRSASFFGGPEDGNEGCVRELLSELQPAVTDYAIRKDSRLRKEAADRPAAEAAVQKEASLEAKKRDDEAREAKREAAIARAQALEQEQQAREEAAKQQELSQRIDSELAAIRPDLDDAQARLSSANTFWASMQREMANRGESLRPEIQTYLRAANSNGARCQRSLESREPDSLRSCINELNKRLDELDNYR